MGVLRPKPTLNACNFDVIYTSYDIIVPCSMFHPAQAWLKFYYITTNTYTSLTKQLLVSVFTEKRTSVSSLSNDAEGSGVTSSVLLSSLFLHWVHIAEKHHKGRNKFYICLVMGLFLLDLALFYCIRLCDHSADIEFIHRLSFIHRHSFIAFYHLSNSVYK